MCLSIKIEVVLHRKSRHQTECRAQPSDLQRDEHQLSIDKNHHHK